MSTTYEEQLAGSRPYTPGRFVPGRFSCVQRNTHHYDIMAPRRDGYVQWYYHQNPGSVVYPPLRDGNSERAFRIRGEPGAVQVGDERWDPEDKERGWLEFPNVDTAFAWIVGQLVTAEDILQKAPE